MFRPLFSIHSRNILRLNTYKFNTPFFNVQRSITTSPNLTNTSNNPKHQLIVTEQILDNAVSDSSLVRELTRSKRLEIWCIALSVFRNRDRFQTGFLIFIEKALDRMEEMQVDKELEAYNELLDCFPKDKFVTRHLIDIIFPPPYPAVELALDILSRMEEKAVIPNKRTWDVLYDGFGRDSLPLHKCGRMYYWFTRYQHHDPYQIEKLLPYNNPFALFGLTCHRIYQDLYKQEDLNVYLEDPNNDFKYVYSYENEKIRKSCEAFDPVEKDIIIEGPHLMYLQKHQEVFYTVRAMAKHHLVEDEGDLLGIGLTGSGCLHSVKFWIENITNKHENIGRATPFYVIKAKEEANKLVLSSDVFLESDVENLTTV